MIPLSVIIEVIKLCGVTSKAGLNTFMPFGVIGLLKNNSVTSLPGRSSMGIPLPSLIVKSKVDMGAAI